MGDPIVERIEREAGLPGLFAALATRIPATDLQSLLLATARRRASHLAPADVLRRYVDDPLCRPAELAPGPLDELERTAYALLPEHYQPLELSPVCPLGTSSVLGGLSQDRILTTVRGSEVVSDPTNVLALECALRRRRDRSRGVHLAASHRALRTTPVEPPLLPHFRLFVLCSGGRSGSESALLAEHRSFFERLIATVSELDVSVDEQPRKQRYYSGPTFALAAGGRELVEGGFVDWTQRLLGDRKERLLISGLGLDGLAVAAGR
jgi:hypothetical protein